jgi:hypothetical protein
MGPDPVMVSFENGRDKKSSVTTSCTYWFIVEVVNTAELYLLFESATPVSTTSMILLTGSEWAKN